jgi:hypothetical protein
MRETSRPMRVLFWIYLLGTPALVVVYAVIGIHGS